MKRTLKCRLLDRTSFGKCHLTGPVIICKEDLQDQVNKNSSMTREGAENTPPPAKELLTLTAAEEKSL